MEALNISARGKSYLRGIINRMANPDSGMIDVVLQEISQERQKQVVDVAKNVTTIQNRVAKRAREGMDAISDAEWDKMVNDAIRDTTS